MFSAEIMNKSDTGEERGLAGYHFDPYARGSLLLCFKGVLIYQFTVSLTCLLCIYNSRYVFLGSSFMC